MAFVPGHDPQDRAHSVQWGDRHDHCDSRWQHQQWWWTRCNRRGVPSSHSCSNQIHARQQDSGATRQNHAPEYGQCKCSNLKTGVSTSESCSIQKNQSIQFCLLLTVHVCQLLLKHRFFQCKDVASHLKGISRFLQLPSFTGGLLFSRNTLNS